MTTEPHRRGRRFAVPALCLSASVLLGGCYAWAEVDPGPVPVGTEIRVTLTRAEALRQAEEDGAIREVIPGQVVEEPREGLALTVPRTGTPAEGGRFRGFVRVPWSEVVRMEERRFSPLRTAFLTAGAGAVIAAILSVAEGESAGGEGEPGGPDQALRIPLLRLRF